MNSPISKWIISSALSLDFTVKKIKTKLHVSKKLKIGFWGNTNNYPFLVARTFRKMGHEVIFIIDDDQKLHRPEHRYREISLPYPDWIKDLSPFPLWLSGNLIDTVKKKRVISLFSDCDFVVLNGYAIRFADEIRKPYLAHLTGSDLIPLAENTYPREIFDSFMISLHQSNLLRQHMLEYRLANHKVYRGIIETITRLFFLRYYDNTDFFERKSFWQNLMYLTGYSLWLKKQSRKQRQAIKKAFTYFYAIKGLIPRGDQLLREIGASEDKKLCTIGVDTDYAGQCTPPANQVIRIFNIARFNWVKDKSNDRNFHDLDFKGNDIMIRGLALFHQKTGNKLDIRFVKKGRDVADTVTLCKETNIESQVTWITELDQAGVLEEYKKADILFDQLGNSVVTMGGLEGMSVGRPLIANARPDIFDAHLGEKTAICHAQTPEQVCDWLEKLVADKSFREKRGKESSDFVRKHFSAYTLCERILKKFEERHHA